MAPGKGKGLSSAISISYGNRGPRLRRIAKSQTVRLNKSARQIATANKAQRDHLAGGGNILLLMHMLTFM
jgi:hypothetical protein